MVECERRDLVRLYLQAVGPPGQGPAPPALTAIGIGDALALGEAAADRVGLLEDLAALEDEGLVASEERPVEGCADARTVYRLTDAGREEAAGLRSRLAEETVEVAEDGETVTLADAGRYLPEEPAPVVAALVRRTDDGRVQLARSADDAFVNRTSDVATVSDAVATSFTRETRAVFVSGPAGVGKTALVEEALERVREDRDAVVVARGDCAPVPTGPYEPLRHAFERLPGDTDLFDRLPAAGAPGADDPDEADARRGALFDDVADGLRAAASERPVVVFLDDLQWADGATLDLFGHLATTVTEWLHPVAFVGTYRATAVSADPDHPVRATLEAVDATEVSIGALSQADTRALLARLLDCRGLPDDVVDMVYDRTGGNPLFVREMATHLLETGAVHPEAGRFPSGLGDVSLPREVTEQIDRRLDHLDDPGRELVRLGAALGERFPTAVLAAASDLPPARRREYVDLLVAVDVWERDGGADAAARDDPHDLTFVSGGFREAVVDRTPADVASGLHERAAAAYVAVYGDDVDERAARVAHHHEAAGDHAAAVEWLRRAGDHARATYAYDDAADSYERALALAREHGAADPETVAEVAADLASVRRLVGDYDGALATAGDALEWAPHGSRAECRLLGIRADVLADRGDYDAVRTVAERQRELAADLGADDLETAAVRRLGRVAKERGAYDEARGYFERALDRARESGDSEAEAACHKQLGGVASDQGDHERACEHLERSLEGYRAVDDRRGEADCLGNLGVVAIFRGDHDRARDHIVESLALQRELGDRPGQANSLNNLGLVAENENEYDRALAYYERSLAIERDLGNRRGEALSLNNLGVVAESRGAYGDAREYYERSLAIERDLENRQGQARVLNNLGVVAMHLGDHERARAQFEQSLAIKRDIGDRTGRAQTLVNLGNLGVATGDHDRAREYLERAADVVADDDAGHVAAERDLVAGRLALARGDHAVARERAAAAREQFDAIDAPHWAARCRRLLGRAAAASGSRVDAREQWRAALDTFEAVDAPQDALSTLEALADACRAAGEQEQAAAWCDRARELLSGAPAPVADRHRDWVTESAEAHEG